MFRQICSLLLRMKLLGKPCAHCKKHRMDADMADIPIAPMSPVGGTGGNGSQEVLLLICTDCFMRLGAEKIIDYCHAALDNLGEKDFDKLMCHKNNVTLAVTYMKHHKCPEVFPGVGHWKPELSPEDWEFRIQTDKEGLVDMMGLTLQQAEVALRKVALSHMMSDLELAYQMKTHIR